MGFALGVLPVVLLLLGFPIFIVLLASVTVALVFFMHVPLAALHQNLFGAIDAFALLAVPFFIYAGELMGRGSVAQRIVDFVQASLGRIPSSCSKGLAGCRAASGSPPSAPRRSSARSRARARRRSPPSAR
jgi:C4-dicarboxylate transporter DctM subunit